MLVVGLVGALTVVGVDAMSQKPPQMKITAKNLGGTYDVEVVGNLYLGEQPKALKVTATAKKSAVLEEGFLSVFVSCRSLIEGDFESETESFTINDDFAQVPLSAKGKISFTTPNLKKQFEDDFKGNFACSAQVRASMKHDNFRTAPDHYVGETVVLVAQVK